VDLATRSAASGSDTRVTSRSACLSHFGPHFREALSRHAINTFRDPMSRSPPASAGAAGTDSILIDLVRSRSSSGRTEAVFGALSVILKSFLSRFLSSKHGSFADLPAFNQQ
jgi:hypothetical protein